jgi:hypothetical protein
MSLVPTMREAEERALRHKEINDALDEVVPQPTKIPQRLNIKHHSQEYCKKFDVFFNGQKQRLCIEADAEKGFIVRYKLGIGSLPVANREGTYETERLEGRVEIKLKVDSVKGK